MNIIQCHTPTNDSKEDDKDQFYERLQSIIAKCLEKTWPSQLGDLNDEVGMDNTGCEYIMERHELTRRK